MAQGRPKKDDTGPRRTARMLVRATDEQKLAIEKLCAKRETTVSDLLLELGLAQVELES